MMAATVQANERERLAAIHDYQILDSPEDEAFDALTTLTARALDVPIALISIVDANRQWHKSRYGIDTVEITRESSFCSQVIARETVFIVRDARTDPRFEDNPLVKGEHRIRFYAGAPLRTTQGCVIGTLCVIDREPRDLSATQTQTLELLAGQVMSLLELRRTERLLLECESRLGVGSGMTQKSVLLTTGTLAAGMGHEINNPLSYILANTDFAIEELESLVRSSPSERLARLIQVLREAREGAERIRKIVRGVSDLARQEAPLVPTNIAPLVETTVKILSAELREHAAVRTEVFDAPPVLAEESRLKQALMNLILNAAQSFAEPGAPHNCITIGAQHVSPGRVSISVTDNGPGIANDVLPRIFDPFFTTKPVGIGQGLGLSISHNIVCSLGGELLCETTIGKGTTFSIVLPVAGRGVTPLESDPLDGEARGRVLLIDDEPGILRSLSRLLSAHYDVSTESDARAALRRFELGEDFDIVFCDLMMPNLSGVELYNLVRNVAPTIAQRFVFISGGDRTACDEILAGIPNERLEKPFNAVELRAMARRLLRASLNLKLLLRR